MNKIDIRDVILNALEENGYDTELLGDDNVYVCDKDSTIGIYITVRTSA